MRVFKAKCVFNLILLFQLSSTAVYFDGTSELNKKKDLDGNPMPYHALVVYDKYFCSGTIIGSRVVLTTAYCFSNMNSVKEVVVKVGSETMSEMGQIITVIEIKMHEYYNKEMPIVNDIALLCLEEHIHLSGRASKVLLQDTAHILQGAVLHISSWITNTTKRHSKKQLLTSAYFNNRAYCQDKYGGYFTASSFCAVYTKESNIIAGIGGPATYLDRLIGILSYTESANKMYSVAILTNVTRFYKWIRKNTIQFMEKYCVEEDIDYHPDDYDDRFPYD